MEGNFQGKILGQVRPSSTAATSIYSPSTNVKVARVFGILITNTTSSADTFRLFIDNAGTTYDETTTIAWDQTIPANGTVLYEFTDRPLVLNNTAANFAVATGTSNSLNFTIYGEESFNF